MRWDSPLVLIAAGTVAIHTILVVFVDAMIVTHPLVVKPKAPHIEMIEVKVDPPPIIKPAAAPIPRPPDPTPPPVATRPTQVQPRTPPPEAPPPAQPAPPVRSDQSGGDPVVAMPDIAPAATGIPVATGKPSGRVGRGGSGGGTGAGSGAGSADAPPPPPVSVATIKTRALPKGDYGYFDAGKEYPAEARQRGIEGAIRVKLVVDAAGRVISATLLNKLGFGLDELAMTRSKKIEFEPARDTDNKPVTSVVVWTFNMTLPK